jgi:lysozyme
MMPSEVLAILEPLVKQFEGCKLIAYKKADNVWTIGYGHTGPEVVEGLIWTQEQAETALAGDLSSHYEQTIALSAGLVNQSPGRQAALTDFVYNLGIGRYKTSTLRSAVLVGAWQSVKIQLALWIHEDGKVEPGLVARRKAECALIDA